MSLRRRLHLSIARRIGRRPVTALIVPVPSLERLILRSARDRGMPPHITLLYPFLPAKAVDSDTVQALAALLARTPAFDFSLARIGRFPGVVYLAPEPSAPFVALTGAVMRRWPEHPAYGGAYEEVVPHLTVAYGDRGPPDLAARLPMQARAEEIWLMARALGRWVRRARFPLPVTISPTGAS